MFIDEITIQVTSGRGGQGAVAWQSQKMAMGPTGAAGGTGGSVYLEGVSDLGALGRLRYKKSFKAEDGGPGQAQFRDGKTGKDIVLPVPVGTAVYNIKTRQERDIVKIGERFLVARGGLGGKGNFHFRSGRNTSPEQFQYGKEGESFPLRLELKLIADVGFVGLPNVGKSSLLNELTAAKSKVANYAFTTLEPNLGVYYDLVLADLPGLIEGASGGRGLGIKFLKHVERTGVLFHFVSAESVDPAGDYQTIRRELGAYKKKLLEKPEYVFVSKSDSVPTAEVRKKVADLKKFNPKVRPLSIYDLDSVTALQKILNKIAKEKKSPR